MDSLNSLNCCDWVDGRFVIDPKKFIDKIYGFFYSYIEDLKKTNNRL